MVLMTHEQENIVSQEAAQHDLDIQRAEWEGFGQLSEDARAFRALSKGEQEPSAWDDGPSRFDRSYLKKPKTDVISDNVSVPEVTPAKVLNEAEMIRRIEPFAFRELSKGEQHEPSAWDDRNAVVLEPSVPHDFNQ